MKQDDSFSDLSHRFSSAVKPPTQSNNNIFEKIGSTEFQIFKLEKEIAKLPDDKSAEYHQKKTQLRRLKDELDKLKENFRYGESEDKSKKGQTANFSSTALEKKRPNESQLMDSYNSRSFSVRKSDESSFEPNRRLSFSPDEANRSSSKSDLSKIPKNLISELDSEYASSSISLKTTVKPKANANFFPKSTVRNDTPKFESRANRRQASYNSVQNNNAGSFAWHSNRSSIPLDSSLENSRAERSRFKYTIEESPVRGNSEKYHRSRSYSSVNMKRTSSLYNESEENPFLNKLAQSSSKKYRILNLTGRHKEDHKNQEINTMPRHQLIELYKVMELENASMKTNLEQLQKDIKSLKDEQLNLLKEGVSLPINLFKSKSV